MHLPRRPELYAALISVLALALPACAQTLADASIEGRVLLAPHAPASHATLLLTSSRDTYKVRTAADGTFTVPVLPPGTYTVSATASFTPPQSFGELTVLPAQTLNLTLDLSSAKPVVLASAPDLPPTTPDQDADGLPASRGLPSTQNQQLLDGLSLTQSFGQVPLGSGTDPAPNPEEDPDAAERTTGPTNGLARGRRAGIANLYSQSAIREFRLSTNLYSAQASQPGGSVATTVSRTGTPALHASAQYTLRSQLFNATEPLAYATTLTGSTLVKPHDLRETLALTVGGPLLRKVYGFYAYEQQRRNFPAVSSPADPAFYTLTASQKALLGNRGVTPSQQTAALMYLASLAGPTPRRADQSLHFLRLDYHPFAFDYQRIRYTAPAALLDAPVVPRGRASLGSASGSIDLLLLRLTNGPNAFHAAWLRDLQYESPQTPLAQEPAISPGGLSPEVNIGPNGFLFGTPAALTQGPQPDERRFDLADTVTFTRRRQTVAFGATAAFTHTIVAALTDPAGTFLYDNSTTGLADFIADYTYPATGTPSEACPSIYAAVHLSCFQSYTQQFGAQRTSFSVQDYAAFTQYTWRARPSLTLNAGLRYDYTLLPIPPAPDALLDATFSARGASSIFPEDRNNLAPRGAIAWSPGPFTVRLGYGIFYGRLPGAVLRTAIADTALPSTTTRIRITPTTEVPCTTASNATFGYGCAFQTLPTAGIQSVRSATVFDRRFRLPAIQQGTFTLERPITRRLTLTAGYLLNLDRQLPGSTDLNIAPSTTNALFQLDGGPGIPGARDGETFSVPVYTARLTPNFGPVTQLTSHANGTYNALLLSADGHLPALELHSTYTWSKALDTGPNLSATPRTDSQFDPFTNRYDKALSTLNEPWAIRANAAWSPHFLGHIILSPDVVARAGRPYSYDISGGTRLPGGHLSVNGSGGALYLPTLGRNTLRLPPTITANLRAARMFALHDRFNLRCAVEAFNVFNHRNLSSVTQRAYVRGTPLASGITPLTFQSAAAIAAEGLNTIPFATPTAASTTLAQARQLQFSLRVSF